MYTAKSLADGGAHGTVYKGEDELNRDFAIKFIRPSVGDRVFVFEQAKALTRIKCPFVVPIHAIEDVVDPDSGEATLAIIMPWLEGKTLDRVLAGPKPTPDDVKRIGIGMIIGMKSIHGAGLAHGDFHFKNAMVGDTWVNIIDILYSKTLSDETAEAKEAKLQNDRNSLRSLLADLLTSIGVDLADEFNRSLSPDSTLDDIHTEFANVTNPRTELDITSLVDQALARVSDSAFVRSSDYADALSDEINPRVIRPLLQAIIAKGMTEPKHKPFINVLWDRLSPEDQEYVCVDLAVAINREVPKGNFAPHLRMLSAFGRRAWGCLSLVTRIRLENAILEDLSEGDYEAQRPRLLSGSLGVWVRQFYLHFTDQAAVRTRLNKMLRGSWGAQNYLGNYLMAFIVLTADAAGERELFVDAFATAVRDNAWCVKGNLDKLPEDWRNEIDALL